MLQITDVTRRFGGARVVDGVSFSVPAGSITGLIGPNGAGKTTVFNLIAGSLPPNSGRIVLDGVEDIAPSRRAAGSPAASVAPSNPASVPRP